MTKDEFIAYIVSKQGTPFNTNRDLSTHSLETGFDCYTWVVHLYTLLGKELVGGPSQYTQLKDLRNQFEKVEKAEFLDIALFYGQMIEVRHMAIMIDPYRATHCSPITNGVSILEINRKPWVNTFKGFYRYK